MTDIDPSADIDLTSANEHGCAARTPHRAGRGEHPRLVVPSAETPHHRPASRIEVVRTGIGAEKRWLLAAALVLAMVVLLLLPSRFSVGPNWIVPVIEGLLLAAIFIAERRSGDIRPAVIRGMSYALVLILVAEAVFVTVRLVTDLVEGGPETNSAADLLSVGFGSGFTRSSPSPSSTGCLTEAVLRRAYGIRRNSRTWRFPSTSTPSLPRRAGVRSSPTTSTSASRMPPRSARPM